VKQVIQCLKKSDKFKEEFDDTKKMVWEIAEDKGLPADVCDMLFPSDALRAFRTVFTRYYSVYEYLFACVSLSMLYVCIYLNVLCFLNGPGNVTVFSRPTITSPNVVAVV
jgi:hypothetical protein